MSDGTKYWGKYKGLEGLKSKQRGYDGSAETVTTNQAGRRLTLLSGGGEPFLAEGRTGKTSASDVNKQRKKA